MPLYPKETTMDRFTKMKKAAGLEEARKAYETGHSVWLGRFWDEVLNFQGSGGIAGSSEFIQAVEEIGWKPQDMSYSWAREKKRGVRDGAVPGGLCDGLLCRLDLR